MFKILNAAGYAFFMISGCYFRRMRRSAKIFRTSFCLFKWVTLAVLLTWVPELKAQKPVKELLQEVREASYFDSVMLFRKGNDLIQRVNDSEVHSEVHLYYGNYYYYIHQIDKARYYFRLSQQEAMLSGSDYLLLLTAVRLAYMDYDAGRRLRAENRLQQLMDSARITGEQRIVCEILNMMALIEDEKGHPQKAAELYYQGLAIAENEMLDYYAAVFRNNLGLIKYYSGEIGAAETDFKLGLVRAERDRSYRVASHLKMNLCLCYARQQKKEDLYALFAEVIKFSRENNLPVEMASNYLNLGSTLMDEEDFSGAATYLDSALLVGEKYGLTTILIRASFGKAEVSLALKKIPEAEKFLNHAFELLDSAESLRDEAIYYSIKYKIEEAKGNYRSALEHYVKYTELNDSVDAKMNRKMIEEMQYDYRVQQKETELEKQRAKIAVLEMQNQKDRFVKWLMAAIALFLIVMVAVVFHNRYLRKVREKQEQYSKKLLENIEEERKRIAMDLHDDIGQNLTIVKSKLAGTLPESLPEIEQDLSRVIEQTREISRELYPSNIEKIGIVRAVASLLEKLQMHRGLECSYEISDDVLVLPVSVQTHLFRIIQECVNNTVKHSGASGLKITIEEKSGEYTFCYMDNGSGLRNQKSTGGIGLLSIRERARMINGKPEMDEKTEKGFRLVIKFKQTSTSS